MKHKGLYDWHEGHAVKSREDAGTPPTDTIDRLLLPMLDVCVTCLREGIVADENIVDGAMIRDWICAVPRRTDALCEDARGRRRTRHAQASR